MAPKWWPGDEKNYEDYEAELAKLKLESDNLRKAVEGLKTALKICRERYQKLTAKYEEAVAKLAERARHYKEEAARLLKAKKEMEEMLNASASYGVFWRMHPGGKLNEVDVIFDDGETKKVTFGVKDRDPRTIKPGSQIVASGRVFVIAVIDQAWPWGSVVQFEERLGEDTVLVRVDADQLEQLYLSPELKESEFKKGDSLLNCNGIVVKSLAKSDGKEHFFDLDDISGESWSGVGGLSRVVQKIQRAILPFKEREAYMKLFKGKKLPRGIILHGPPGCGKTKCAKAIANDLASARGLKPYFMEFVGAELTDKYVGETARKLREVFARAQEKARDGGLVLVFIDEIDSLFRSREGSEQERWIATDIGQFNKILDGMDPLGDVLIIAATNQKHLVDKAILRPGRLGIDIYVPRPKTDADVREILRIYLTSDLPFAKKYLDAKTYHYTDHFGTGKEETVEFNGNREKIQEHFIDVIIKRIFYDGPPKTMVFDDDGKESIVVNNRFRASTSEGDKEILLKDSLSGALLESVVESAKAFALDRYNRRKSRGHRADIEITKKDFFRAIDEVMQGLKNSSRGSSQKTITGFSG